MNNNEVHEMFIAYQSRHQRKLFALILTLVPNWNDAEEILQETSIVLWRKFSDFKPGTSYIAWASQVARYEVLKFRTRQQRGDRLFGDDLIELLAVETGEMSEQLEDQELALRECLKKLRDQDRHLVKSRYFRGATASSLATSLGRSVESVCNSLKRIRADLLHCVQREQTIRP